MIAREECLKKAMEIVCTDRESQYGAPEDNFAKIADLWGAYLGYPVTAEDVSMMMVLLKIARASTGKFKADNYIDLAGYAACGMEIAGKSECRSDGDGI